MTNMHKRQTAKTEASAMGPPPRKGVKLLLDLNNPHDEYAQEADGKDGSECDGTPARLPVAKLEGNNLSAPHEHAQGICDEADCCDDE
eukprot:CAMPEP_0173414746 /NCGR_PEP_ID=MMETSP1356-20130122/84492_1 /TAXON_ID=77927 ORGANISM="Hemiselmis virescens, Strain PCC157" /NCGR_SAMPLE_ID=MMETSP1356 /ASSEMBLY_ACC=CAM_ASM_000847 /LENGTH=87 /DNA_ID=CAMNT_0014376949 /DNA_START=426 /DNA_END=689 /DNA_ORIENTATION=+